MNADTISLAIYAALLAVSFYQVKTEINFTPLSLCAYTFILLGLIYPLTSLVKDHLNDFVVQFKTLMVIRNMERSVKLWSAKKEESTLEKPKLVRQTNSQELDPKGPTSASLF